MVVRMEIQQTSTSFLDFVHLCVLKKNHKFVLFPSIDWRAGMPPTRMGLTARDILCHISENLNRSSNAVWRRLRKIPVFWYVTVSLGEKLLVFKIQHNPSKQGNYLFSDIASYSGRLVPSTTPPQGLQPTFWTQNHCPGQKLGSL